MTIVVVEVNRCAGHARCAAVAPELFVLDDDGYLRTPTIELPAGFEHLAQRAIRACPERALKLSETDSESNK
jgi:ferredoxin